MKVIFFFIFLTTVIIRFLWLDKFPVGMTNDELEYVLSAKSYLVTGTDISGVGLPLSIFKSNTEGSISITPVLISSAMHTIFPLNQQTARLPYVLISLISAWLIYKIVFVLLKNQWIALLSCLLFLLNPWSFYLSRYAADSPYALLFYLAGIYSLLAASGKKIFLALVFFVLGFFSYHGAKPLFLPIIFIVTAYKYLPNIQKKNWAREFLNSSKVIVLLTIIFLAAYFIIDKNVSGTVSATRTNEIFFFNSQLVSSIVNEQRKLSLESPLQEIFNNKPIAIFKIFTEKYLTSFSPEVLFFKGDPRAAYRFENYGLMHLVDIIFIFLGAFFLARNNLRVFLLIVCLVLVAPLSTAINRIETSVIHRSFLLLPLLIILQSVGVNYAFMVLRKILSKQVVLGVLGFVYVFSFLSFLNFYFLRYPITHQETYLLSENILSKYASFKREGDLLVASEQPRYTYLRYIFNNYPNNKNEISKIPENIKSRSYQAGNSKFISFCSTENDTKTTYAISRNISECELGKERLQILDQKDSGYIYKIYNDKVCNGVTLDSWRRFHYLSDYNLTEMDKDTFCKGWITVKND